MEFYRIKKTSDAWFPAFRDCFEASFPESERRPPESLKDKIEHEDRFHCEVALQTEPDRQRFLGLLCWWQFDGFCYVEYLAVSERLRGQGRGGKIIRALQAAVQQPVVLEVEPPADDITRRRVGFYQRQDFRLLPDDYMQPSYGIVPGLPLRLMLWKDLPAEWGVQDLIRTLHREVYGVNDRHSSD